MRRFTLLFGLAALIALGSDKALTGTAGNIGGGDRWQFRLRLSAPEPGIQEVPNRPELGKVLSIPTFGLSQVGKGRAVAGRQIPLPVKVVRVAIPEGATVSLEPIRAERRLLKGLRLGPEKDSSRGRFDSDSGPTATPGTGKTGTSSHTGFAGGSVRLGQTGYFRFQRFVEVIYTPVVRPPSKGAQDDSASAESSGAAQPSDESSEAEPAPIDLDFYPEVEVNLVVDGVDESLLEQKTEAAPEDPQFEDSYRAAFLNYKEGRRFRVGPHSTEAVTGLSSSAVSSGLAVVPARTSPFANATSPVYRVVVKRDGIYRLSWTYLLNPTTGVAPGLAGATPGSFRILNRGAEVPIRVVSAVSGTFASGDFIEFYGEGMLGEPKLTLNFDFSTIGQPGVPPINQANDFTDENVYFLFAEPGTHARIPDLAGNFTSGPPQESKFDETAHREFDTRFVPNGIDDPFFQDPFLGSASGNFNPDPNALNCGYTNTGIQSLSAYLGPSFTQGDPHYCQACALGLPDPLSVPDPATVRVRMRGASFEAAVTPDHMTVVQVGTVASQSSTMCWDGESTVVQSLTVPQTALSSGAGILIGEPGLAATVSTEFLFLDWIEVDYKRALKLNNGQVIARFSNADRSYLLSGFPTNTPADLVVYDISRSVAGSTVPSPRRVTGATIGGSAGNFTMLYTLLQDTSLMPGARRAFAAGGSGGFLLPARVETVADDDLLSTTNAADMIILTTPAVVDRTPGSAFSTYVSHRASDSSLDTRVVMMKNVYDYFSDGVESPEAIRAFLAYAFDNWKGPSGNAQPPSYLLLVGDATLDYKNNLNLPTWVDEVPSFIMYTPNPILSYYASDNYLGAFIGIDQLPDIHLGRVSVRSPADSEPVFQKMLDYDTNPPTGSWRAQGTFVADIGKDSGETQEFESTQTAVADNYFTSPFSNNKLYYDDPNYRVAGQLKPDLWRADFVNRMNAGSALTSFLGHGSFAIWGAVDNLFSSSDTASFSPTNRPTFLVNENCLAGGFHFLGGDALGEAFLKKPSAGAIAVFAPAGLSLALVGSNINDALYPDLFGLTKERRFGNLMTDVKLALAFSMSDLQAYTLLGDPAQRLVLPGPRPPSGFSATSGLDAHVDLHWTASPDPGVTTRVYRTEMPSSSYTLLNPSGTTGTAYTDATAINGRVYFYRAVSLDPTGVFEGGVTNLNSTCNSIDPNMSGSDCVWAKALNPNPPAIPANFRVINPGLGDQLQVAWDPTAEPDLQMHSVHYGTSPGGPYPNTLQIPMPATVGMVRGLAMGVTYYFVATATNTSNRTSAFSQEAGGIPRIFDGTTPPDFITSLTVIRSPGSPDSIELHWTPPSLDIYGAPVTLASFSIYRATTPAFIPSGSNRIALITNPAAGVYLDPGAFIAPPNYFYLVTTTDNRGFTSGAGRQLPNGITDLDLRISGSNLNFAWSPVSTDVNGASTLVDHYALYMDTQQVGRPRLDSLAPFAPSIATAGFTTTIPAGTMVYFSVLVVDDLGNKSPF